MKYITEHNIERIALLLLCIGTLSSGISAFFQNDFGGKMQQNYIESIHTFWKATTEYTEALSQIQNTSLENLKDDLLYYEWQNKTETDPEEAEYLLSRLSEWLQKDINAAQNGDDGTGSYFEEQEKNIEQEIETKLALYEEGMEKAETILSEWSRYNSKGDKMTLVSILLSMVLFIWWIASTSSISFFSRKYIILVWYSILIFAWWIFFVGLF